MGEFGGNDYVFILAAGKTLEELVPYVPKVVQAISAGIEVVHSYILNDFTILKKNETIFTIYRPP